MFSLLRNWFFPFFLIFTILAEPIFHAFCSAAGISVESGMLSYVFIGIFIVSIALFAKDCSRGWKNLNVNKVISILLLLLFLYYASSIFQSTIPPLYYTYFLVFGSKCIPACLIGMHLARDGNKILQKVDIILPIFIIVVGIPLGLLGYKAAMLGEVLKDPESSSLNYQIYSYYMAEFYVYCAYYLFLSSIQKKLIYKCLRIPMFALLFFFAICCLMGGGRGAFVFIVFATVFILIEMYKLRRLSHRAIILIIFVTGVIFSYVANKIGVFDSAGFERIAINLTDDSSREDLRNAAFSSFSNSPIIGHGLGSVWWEVGFYSHNMIFDVMVEAGVIGLALILYLGITLVYRMTKLCRYNSCYLFLMLMFLEQATKGMFSGYYFGLYHLWMIFGLTMVFPDNYYDNINGSSVLNSRLNNFSNKRSSNEFHKTEGSKGDL